MTYLEAISPSIGGLPPRAFVRSDAPTLSLNGVWRFRLSLTADAPEDFVSSGFDDAGWHQLTVPSHWVLQGHGAPIYTNSRFPIPVDPPYVPTQNPTGDHRRVFDLPADWSTAVTPDAAVLRFDGIESCGRVWLNGVELGVTFGSRLPTEFAVGHVLRPIRNVVAARVHQWSAGTYVEDQDMWWLPGIFRDVTLIARPRGGPGDVRVRADFDHSTGAGSLLVHTDRPARVSCAELGLSDLPTGVAHTIAVSPWTAETPRLYGVEVATDEERVTVPVGFRTVAVEDGLLRVNGRRVLLRGVNRHEFDPDNGRAVREDVMRADLVLMKQHNINAVRTSHYPPHPRFLELCDELGMWVIDECDLETHGFVEADADWRGNPTADPAWREALVDRLTRMVARDRNHPSIILWSLGNEAGVGENVAHMAEAIRELDPSRPVHYEGDQSCRHTDVYSRMYVHPDEVDLIGQRNEEPLDDPHLDARRRGMPFILCEYGHAMGNGPGALMDYQRLFEKYDRCQGGFIWEWVDHGIRARISDGREFFAYGGDFGEELHDGNFVCDGLLFPDRTPSPGLLEYKKVIEPVRIGAAGDHHFRVENRYDFAALVGLVLRWCYDVDGVTHADGDLPCPPLAAGESVIVPLPFVSGAPAGETWWTVRAVLGQERPWASPGHEIAWGQWPAQRSATAHRTTTARRPAGARVTFPGTTTATFDVQGQLTRLGYIDLVAPRLDVWRAPTDNDADLWGPRLAKRWRRHGLHRIHHRLIDVNPAHDALVVRTRVAPAGEGFGLFATYRWSGWDDILRLDLDVTPDGTWPVPLPRLGLRLAVPAQYDCVEWFGRGPGEAYVDTQQAARVGRYSACVDDLQTPYVRPQENGARIDVRWAAITDRAGAGVRIDGDPAFQLTVRRWTSEHLDAARHTTDLVAGEYVWINVDLAQHGIGSSSCGPAVLAHHELHPHPVRFSVSFQHIEGAKA